MMIIFY